MFVEATHSRREQMPESLELARVLLVHNELAPRLILQTLLQAGGYSVDVAASTAEAYAKLDENSYELVLTDVGLEEPEAGRKLLSYARVKSYQPATAVVNTAWRQDGAPGESGESEAQVSIDTEDVTVLLGQVADLIGLRARRRSGRGRGC